MLHIKAQNLPGREQPGDYEVKVTRVKTEVKRIRVYANSQEQAVKLVQEGYHDFDFDELPDWGEQEDYARYFASAPMGRQGKELV